MAVQHYHNYLLFVWKISSCSAAKSLLYFQWQAWFFSPRWILVSASSNLPQHLILIFSQKLQHRAWCLEPFHEQDFSSWSSHRRANSNTGAEFLVPPHASTSVFKFITAVSEGQWFDLSELLLVPVFLWELMRFWEWMQPWDGNPRAAWWHQFHVPGETRASWDASYHLSCFFAKGAGFINWFSYSTVAVT